MDEKKCPFCAETIKAEAIKCRFCGESLISENKPQAQSVAQADTAGVASCERCNVALVQTRVTKSVSASGFLSLLLCIGGLLFLFGGTARSFLAGAVLLALGVVVGTIGGKKTVMMCPKCGERGATLAS